MPSVSSKSRRQAQEWDVSASLSTVATSLALTVVEGRKSTATSKSQDDFWEILAGESLTDHSHDMMRPAHQDFEIIDSHVHLWPTETCNEDGHSWMTPGHPLRRPYLLNHYLSALNDASAMPYESAETAVIRGFVYIETDVQYLKPSDNLAEWAKGPLDEITFLRRVVEDCKESNGAHLPRGIIPWAPMHRPTNVLEEYLTQAQNLAGEVTWSRVKGFRFLLQGMHDPSEFRTFVLSDAFIANLKLLGKRGFSFDIGVDQNSGGLFQLELVSQAIHRAHADVHERDRVCCIINHLCKPNFDADNKTAFVEWKRAIDQLAAHSRTYMKLSGAFSELSFAASDSQPPPPQEIATRIRPWVQHVLHAFGPARIMFGSDWPVCNLKGPSGLSSWRDWYATIQILLDDGDWEMSRLDKERIWAGTAIEAYRLQ